MLLLCLFLLLFSIMKTIRVHLIRSGKHKTWQCICKIHPITSWRWFYKFYWNQSTYFGSVLTGSDLAGNVVWRHGLSRSQNDRWYNMSKKCPTCRADKPPTLNDVAVRKGIISIVVTQYVANITPVKLRWAISNGVRTPTLQPHTVVIGFKYL